MVWAALLKAISHQWWVNSWARSWPNPDWSNFMEALTGSQTPWLLLPKPWPTGKNEKNTRTWEHIVYNLHKTTKSHCKGLMEHRVGFIFEEKNRNLIHIKVCPDFFLMDHGSNLLTSLDERQIFALFNDSKTNLSLNSIKNSVRFKSNRPHIAMKFRLETTIKSTLIQVLVDMKGKIYSS